MNPYIAIKAYNHKSTKQNYFVYEMYENMYLLYTKVLDFSYIPEALTPNSLFLLPSP